MVSPSSCPMVRIEDNNLLARSSARPCLFLLKIVYVCCMGKYHLRCIADWLQIVKKCYMKKSSQGQRGIRTAEIGLGLRFSHVSHLPQHFYHIQLDYTRRSLNLCNSTTTIARHRHTSICATLFHDCFRYPCEYPCEL